MPCVETVRVTAPCTRGTMVAGYLICGASVAWSMRVSGCGGFDESDVVLSHKIKLYS